MSKSKDKASKEDRETTSSRKCSLPRPTPVTESKDKQKSSKKKMLLKEVANMEKEKMAPDIEEYSVGQVKKKKKKEGKESKPKRQKSGKKTGTKDDTVDDAAAGNESRANLIDASGFADTVPNSNSLVDISAANGKQVVSSRQGFETGIFGNSGWL